MSHRRFFDKEIFVILSSGLSALFILLSSVFIEMIFKSKIGNIIFLIIIIWNILTIMIN